MTSDTNVGDDSVYLRLVLRLSSSTAIPRLFNRLDTDGISIQQLRRERHGDRPAVNVDLGPLTDTQLETLKMAYVAGYYASPRETDLGELSDDLGVSKSAVSQRLKAAEAKLVASVVDALID